MGGALRCRQRVVGADEIRVVIEGAAECGVRAGTVVALTVILEHEFPVTNLDDAGPVRDL